MPNVMLYGYGAAAHVVRGQVEKVLRDLGITGDPVTTIVLSEVRYCGGTNDDAPYLRLCESDQAEVARIKAAFASDPLLVQQDLEVMHVDEFIPGVKSE